METSSDPVEEQDLRVRQVTDADCRLLWEWARDPAVRAASFSSDPIPWERHVRWFAERQRDSGCAMYIVVDASGEPIGQVRFTLSGSQADIHVSISKGHRGRGLGARALRVACGRYVADCGPVRIVAHVRPNNMASVRAFEAGGFRRLGAVTIRGNRAIRLDLDPSPSAAKP